MRCAYFGFDLVLGPSKSFPFLINFSILLSCQVGQWEKCFEWLSLERVFGLGLGGLLQLNDAFARARVK